MGLTGSLVLTVQGMIFLLSIIFYLFVEEPQRRATFFARFALPGKSSPEIGRPPSAG
jgi:simple sugar transport system permease protein